MTHLIALLSGLRAAGNVGRALLVTQPHPFWRATFISAVLAGRLVYKLTLWHMRHEPRRHKTEYSRSKLDNQRGAERPRLRRQISPHEDALSFGYTGLFVGFFLAYLGAELVLAGRLHAYHWLSAGIGAGVVGSLAYGLILWHGRRHQ